MSQNGGTSKRIRAFADSIPERGNDVKKAFAKEFLTAVVPATPVKSGKARSNWMVGVGKKNAATRSQVSRSGDVALTQGARIISGAKVGQAIHISNNLPYIQRLNEGWSAQAPAGFIERAYQSAKAMLGRINFAANKKARS
jgi:hypothetical protein